MSHTNEHNCPPPADTLCPAGTAEDPSRISGAVYQASPDYIHRKVADMNVLISVGGNIANFNGYVQLNPSAAAIWDALAQPQTAAQLAELLQNTYGIGAEQAAADVQEFLDLLVQHGMAVVQ